MAYSLGAKIRSLRGHMTMEEMAEKINSAYGTSINKSMISKWENNITEPSLDTARILVKFFNVTLDELLGLNEIQSIAAHHDGEDWTEQEKKDLEEFKEILRLRRILKANKE